ncbi:MAG: Maf family protein [Candidatus Berkiellales bacterium]
MQKIILASSSIYRKELLERLQIPFNVFSPEVDESPLPGESCQDLVLRLALAKAIAAAQLFPDAICIGSDELATVDHTLLGKPGDHPNAVKQLQQMSNQKVFFYTSVGIAAPNHYTDAQLAVTAVKFRSLTASMIENYLAKEQPYWSAGSFKSEALGSALIERFEGEDPTAIIGLPLILLCEMLSKIGIEVI